jgi:hypothetical protein
MQYLPLLLLGANSVLAVPGPAGINLGGLGLGLPTLTLPISVPTALASILDPIVDPLTSALNPLTSALNPLTSALNPLTSIIDPILNPLTATSSAPGSAATGGGLLDQCVVANAVVALLITDPSASAYCSDVLSIKTVTVSTQATVTPAVVTTKTTLTLTNAKKTVTSILKTTTVSITTKTAVLTKYATNKKTLAGSTKTISCFTAATTLGSSVGKRDDDGDHNPHDAFEDVMDKRDEDHDNPHGSLQRSVEEVEMVKRDDTPVPSLLAGIAAPLITQGCECMSLPTPTTTITNTKTLVAKTTTLKNTAFITPTTILKVNSVIKSISLKTVTATVSLTVTSTVTPAGAAATVPALNGLTYYVYDNTFVTAAGANMNPAAFQSTKYSLTGKTKSLNLAFPATGCTLPDGKTFSNCKMGVVLQGFFYAPTAGKYTFTSSKTVNNEYLYFWQGANALAKTWSSSNKAFEEISGSADGVATVTLAKGQILPVTFLYVNKAGTGRMSLTVTPPGGSATTDLTKYLVPACSAGNPFFP